MIIKLADVGQMISHPIPYQGSKRALASQIMSFAKVEVQTLYEPFAGSAAISLYAAKHNLAKAFVIGDSLKDLIELWKLIVNQPEGTSNSYEAIWLGQENSDQNYFYRIREEYNQTRDPIMLLYLIARCVKNAVRFNQSGGFSQSADKRRKGMHPDKMRQNIMGASNLLKGRVEFFAGDFRGCINTADRKDLIYLDPPYQGTSNGRDKRYFAQLNKDDLCAVIRELNINNIPFLLSYDGLCGNKKYGSDLPEDLEMERVYLNAGRSSQSTLNGLAQNTLESLYISKVLSKDSVLLGTVKELQLPLFS